MYLCMKSLTFLPEYKYSIQHTLYIKVYRIFTRRGYWPWTHLNILQLVLEVRFVVSEHFVAFHGVLQVLAQHEVTALQLRQPRDVLRYLATEDTAMLFDRTIFSLSVFIYFGGWHEAQYIKCWHRAAVYKSRDSTTCMLSYQQAYDISLIIVTY